MRFKKTYLILIIFIISIFVVFKSVDKRSFLFLEDFVSSSQREFIKKRIFSKQYISTQHRVIRHYFGMEGAHKENNYDLLLGKINQETLSNNKILDRYAIIKGIYLGRAIYYPGTGYIDFHEDNLFILSARGILGYTKDLENELKFKQIKNNIDKFIGLDQFLKNRSFAVLDLLIFQNKIFVSFTNEMEDNCWNTSVLMSDLNYKEVKFEKLFFPDECVHMFKNKDKQFHPHPSGGRMIGLDKDHIVLTTGPFRSRFLAQDKNSVNGKIIKINLNDKSYKLFSMGHRNPQGLFFDKKNNFILETEHGPKGGDEINLIYLDELNNNNIPNYGWPISSAGEHYSDPNGDKYKKYPLYNSHSKYGFIEPLKSFVPSIGISEIVKIGDKKYVFGSLKKRTLYFFKLDNENEIIELEGIKIFERIRDLKFYNGKVFLLLEETPSIGVISLS